MHPQDTPLDVVLRMKHLRPAFELRAHWNYNNLVNPLSPHSSLLMTIIHAFSTLFLIPIHQPPLFEQMYILGSHLISKYSGMPYTEYIKQRIFTPLNMTSTTYKPSEAAASGKATENWTGKGRRIPWWFSDDMVELNAGPGGVISNVPDMVRSFGFSFLRDCHPNMCTERG